MNLSLLPDSELIQGLDALAHQFSLGRFEKQSLPDLPHWHTEFPAFIGELHRVLGAWPEIIPFGHGSFGVQDSLYLPPYKTGNNEYLLVRENQGGFALTLAGQNGNWTAHRIENSDSTVVQSLIGYLISFSLQEFILGAPLWAINEEMSGLSTEMMSDISLVWSDTERGGFVPDGDVRIYWHDAGALLLSDERGRVDVGTHNLQLKQYFEERGLFDIRNAWDAARVDEWP